MQAVADIALFTQLGSSPAARWEFAWRLAIDLVSVVVLIRFIYFRYYRRADLFLTFFSFNLIIFLITSLLSNVQMSLGAAFGLFAVFSMLRYRTEGISAKDMTYLFLVIGLGLIMAVSTGDWRELSSICLMIIVLTQLLEGNVLARRELTQAVLYDRIALIHSNARADLIDDLKSRTGLNVHRVDVQNIDFIRDSAQLTVYYYA